MEVDREIVAPALESARQLEVAHELNERRFSRRDDDFADVRITRNDRRGRRLDDVADVGVRKSLPKRADGRRRKDYVADLTETDKKDTADVTPR
jgi:hypothetical protein